MQLGDLNKVWEIRALKRRPRHDEAKEILDRIAKQVQPIMRKHKWRVKVLSEFCPKRRELLGLNVGAGIEVKVRLRRPDRELEFYPFDQVLDTMLHELCHNAHGPHNASFYQLWDQLRKECEELMAKGITGAGQGFDAPGRRLGGFSRQPPLSALRKTALASAENRQKLNTLLPSGPLRLGGDKKIMTALSPVQAAAMAAERRLQDDIWCASVSGGLVAEEESSDQSETVIVDAHSAPSSSALDAKIACSSGAVSRKRSPESGPTLICGSHRDNIANVVDLTGDVNPNSPNVCNMGSNKKLCGSSTTSQSIDARQGSSLASSSTGISASTLTLESTATNNCGESVTWTCETCTLVNPPLALVCEACETLKPKDSSLKYKFWSCKFCTLENSISLDKCSACDRWRYSNGPPLATLPPNLGT